MWSKLTKILLFFETNDWKWKVNDIFAFEKVLPKLFYDRLKQGFLKSHQLIIYTFKASLWQALPFFVKKMLSHQFTYLLTGWNHPMSFHEISIFWYIDYTLSLYKHVNVGGGCVFFEKVNWRLIRLKSTDQVLFNKKFRVYLMKVNISIFMVSSGSQPLKHYIKIFKELQLVLFLVIATWKITIEFR